MGVNRQQLLEFLDKIIAEYAEEYRQALIEFPGQVAKWREAKTEQIEELAGALIRGDGGHSWKAISPDPPWRPSPNGDRIKALRQLIADYPAEVIPETSIEALEEFTGLCVRLLAERASATP